MTWDIQDRDGTSKWELAGTETGKRNLPQTWDFQDGIWQVGRREEEFTT